MSDPLDFLALSEDLPSEFSTHNQEATTYGKLVNEIQAFRVNVYPYYDDYLNIRSSAPAEEKWPSTFVSQDHYELACGADFRVFPGQLFENFERFDPPSSRVLGWINGDEELYGDFKFRKRWGMEAGGAGMSRMIARPTRVAVALKVSVKSINKANNRSVVLGTFLKEIRVMGKLKSCTGIVDLLGVAFVGREAEVKPTLVVKLALGNAVDFYRSPTFAGRATWDLKSHFSLNIGDALRAVHAIDLIHADVKGKNVLIFPHDQTGFCAKLSDFGNCVPKGSARPRALGTMEYLPPECLGPDENVNPTASASTYFGNAHYRDIYMFGLFIWEVATNCKYNAPFKDLNSATEITSLKSDDNGAAAKHLLALVPDDTPQHFRDIISGTLSPIPMQRTSLDQIIESLDKTVERPSLSTNPRDSSPPDISTSTDNSDQLLVTIPWSLQQRLYEEAGDISNQNMDNASVMDSKIYLAYCYILSSERNHLRDSALEHIRLAARHNPFYFVQGSQLTPFAAMLQLQDWKGLSDLLPNDPDVADDGRLSPISDQFLGHIYAFGWRKLLMLACEAGSAEPEGSLSLESLRRASEIVAVSTMRFLIAAGHKDIGQIPSGHHGFTTLHWASFSGKSRLVTMLLANAVDVDARDEQDRTALHLCCQARLLSDGVSREISSKLVEHQRDAVNAVMAWKLYTPLRFAVDVQKPELCEYLILNGADVNARAQHGSTPLQECAWVTGFGGKGDRGEGSKDEQKALKIARLLLTLGKVNIDERTCHNSVTAIAIAATHGNFFDMVSLLLDYGADPNTACDSLTTLCAAVWNNNPRMFSLLLEKRADPNFFVEDTLPLGIAVVNGRHEMVSMLLDRGAKLDVLHKGQSLVIWAIKLAARTKTDVVPPILNLLLHRGAPVTATTQMGVSKFSPIYFAAKRNLPNVTQFLLHHGASIIEKNPDEGTLLQTVIDSSDFEDNDDALITMIDLLIGSGAELDAINHKGETALHYACKYRLERIIAHLLAAGSDFRIKTADGTTSRDLYLGGSQWAEQKKLPVLGSTLTSLEHDESATVQRVGELQVAGKTIDRRSNTCRII